MYCIEESTCDKSTCCYFSAPHSDSAPGELWPPSPPRYAPGLGAILIHSFLISTFAVPLPLTLPVTSHLWSFERCQTVVTNAAMIRTHSVQ